ncbi:hypothetical protein RHMOL_Rhmol07G0198000 [Rhododendron molle]|uniref:Uncharacterized protein n=1 Tax=Rhododendron molle TaxID=49168 RepID=A0ACC0N2H9_RHOML|nr:hypothetical protein RHMOL_Rhmol07G0198000 [Rhododendron molle]
MVLTTTMMEINRRSMNVMVVNGELVIISRLSISGGSGMSSMIGLPTDRALVEDDECLRWISMYANNQDLFFEDFKNVYIKLVNTGAMWKPSL